MEAVVVPETPKEVVQMPIASGAGGNRAQVIPSAGARRNFRLYVLEK